VERCADFRELLSLNLEGELDGARADEVREHLATCTECAELSETMAEIMGCGAAMAALEPPETLAADLAESPCRLWLGLLFQAVDHEISQRNLERLLSHLESCPSCRRTWQDMTLMHQVGEAIKPSEYLVKRCINARDRKPKSAPILNRRLATAAAYLLAVMTSLIVGNPVTLARSQAVPAVERVAEVVTTEVAEVAQQGRGEVRVMLWRVWKWGENKVDTVRSYITGDEKTTADDDNAADADANEGATS
jgi:predicted anti-sigma-YlaC factor YlaD